MKKYGWLLIPFGLIALFLFRGKGTAATATSPTNPGTAKANGPYAGISDAVNKIAPPGPNYTAGIIGSIGSAFKSLTSGISGLFNDSSSAPGSATDIQLKPVTRTVDTSLTPSPLYDWTDWNSPDMSNSSYWESSGYNDMKQPFYQDASLTDVG